MADADVRFANTIIYKLNCEIAELRSRNSHLDSELGSAQITADEWRVEYKNLAAKYDQLEQVAARPPAPIKQKNKSKYKDDAAMRAKIELLEKEVDEDNCTCPKIKPEMPGSKCGKIQPDLLEG